MIYTIWDQSPMKWHKALTYFLLPLTVLYNLSQLPPLLADLPGFRGTVYHTLYLIDIVYYLLLIVLSVFAIYFGRSGVRRWIGPVFLLSSYGLNTAYPIYWLCVCTTIFPNYHNLLDDVPWHLIGSLLGLSLHAVYYYKRRLLFSPPPAASMSASSQDAPRESFIKRHLPSLVLFCVALLFQVGYAVFFAVFLTLSGLSSIGWVFGLILLGAEVIFPKFPAPPFSIAAFLFYLAQLIFNDSIPSRPAVILLFALFLALAYVIPSFLLPKLHPKE